MAFSDNQERHRKALRSFELKMIIARYRPPPQTLIAAAVLIQIVARHRSIRGSVSATESADCASALATSRIITSRLNRSSRSR